MSDEVIFTYDQLNDLGACQKQLDLFENFFGNRVIVTDEVVQKYAREFDIVWIASSILDNDSFGKFNIFQLEKYIKCSTNSHETSKKMYEIQCQMNPLPYNEEREKIFDEWEALKKYNNKFWNDEYYIPVAQKFLELYREILARDVDTTSK